MSGELKDGNTISLTKEELRSIVGSAVGAAVQSANEKSSAIFAESMEKLASAIIESKKPYVDPRNEENEKAMRESMRLVNERMHQQVLASQKTCPHLQGSSELSDFSGQLSSIVRHQLDNGVVVGICTNCQLTIYSDDADIEVQKIFRMKSGNRMSSAGRRHFTDPNAAMKAGRLQNRA